MNIIFSEDQRRCDRYNKIHKIQYKKNKMVEYYYILNYLWQDLLKISLCKHHFTRTIKTLWTLYDS